MDNPGNRGKVIYTYLVYPGLPVMALALPRSDPGVPGYDPDLTR